MTPVSGVLTLMGWWGLLAALAVMILVGALPGVVIRLAVLLFPRGHDRRAEYVAEVEHVRTLREVPGQYMWVGKLLVEIVWEGVPARPAARRAKRLAAKRATSRRVWLQVSDRKSAGSVAHWGAHEEVTVSVRTGDRETKPMTVAWHVAMEVVREDCKPGEVMTVKGPGGTEVRMSVDDDGNGGGRRVAPGRHKAGARKR